MSPARSPRSTEPDPSRPRALFVLGSPRSGTTLIGSYLGSSPSALDLGEYGGFHVAHGVVPAVIGRFPGPLRDRYLADLCAHAQRFAEDAARENGRAWYCDGTPWNLRIAAALADQLPDALFVLLLRHYSGTVQSLRRSYAAGFHWAGSTFEESARVWSAMYERVADLPSERTIVVGYDRLGMSPAGTLEELENGLRAHGIDPTTLDRRQLTVSHARPGTPGPTVAVMEGTAVRLRPFQTFVPEAWSGDIHAAVWPVVGEVHQMLQARYPGDYLSPPPPVGLTQHDEIHGLIPFEARGW